MSTSVLVINCGSSSIKYALIPDDGGTRLEGLAEQLGSADARIKGKNTQGERFEQAIPNAGHAKAVQAILQHLDGHQPQAIGHRVVHGGEQFTQAVRLDEEVLDAIRATSPLAPLHNPANLIGIAATTAVFADLPQVAVFDTAFHQTLPAHAYRYPLPDELYTAHGIRRYGFHGSSHAYVSQRANQLAGETQTGWLSAHLGNGCSTTAIWQGKSVDTSMGLTPLEGVVMGTRSGDIDPGLHAHLHRHLGWSIDQIDQMLNKQSGLLGLSMLSNDMRTLTEAAAEGHQGARLAIDVFCYRLAKSLAALSCALPKLTGLIFTGGIGENAADIRAQTLALLPHFGLQLDPALNQHMVRGAEGRIDAGQGPQIWVIPTDEEGQIAQETRQTLHAQ
ncbi:MAG: acetate kinase [Pseudomonadota bacterium]|nr:acetate kinase [Pseudomonadota bacterium]